MDDKLKKPLEHVPDQYTGAASDTVAHRQFNSKDDTISRFDRSVNKLLDINNWENLGAGLPGSRYDLIDSSGKKVHRSGEEGLYIRIELPAPPGSSGEGYDWVKIESIVKKKKDTEDIFIMRVRPSQNPENSDKDVAHFFDSEATNNFIIYRKKNDLYMIVSGRNENVNDDVEAIWDKVRNAVIGLAAKAGLSTPQWILFAEAIIAE